MTGVDLKPRALLNFAFCVIEHPEIGVGDPITRTANDMEMVMTASEVVNGTAMTQVDVAH